MKTHVIAFITLMASVLATPVYGQNVSVGDLKSKGATLLSADEVKALLSGALLRYESIQNVTQLRMNADGSLTGSSRSRSGAAAAGSGGSQYAGDWRVTETGQWCAETRRAGSPLDKYCRVVFRLGDTYYYVSGTGRDDTRPAVELSVSK